MKFWIFIIIIFAFTSCSPIKKLYVRYGSASETMRSKNTEGDIRIYFDRFGSIYPDYKINDEQLKKNITQLTNLYTSDSILFGRIISNYKLPIVSSYEDLQVKLIENAANKINNISKSKKIIFLIHGFNKHPTLPKFSSSESENEEMKNKIRLNLGSECQFVEIYWDGCTWVNGIKLFEFTNSFRIWKYAQPASNNVGLELRRILNLLNREEIYVITHSLGASVITCALFNVDKFKSSKYQDEIAKLSLDSNKYRTPVQKFKIGMIAPAIPGENTFNDYYSRTPNSKINDNNFQFVIGHNSKDLVLKKYLWLSTRMGSTSLGSKKTELAKVKSMLNVKENSLIKSVDFCRKSNGKKQHAHAFSEYIKNEMAISQMLKLVFVDSKSSILTTH